MKIRKPRKQKTIKALLRRAKRQHVKLNVLCEIDPARLDAVWYKGVVASVEITPTLQINVSGSEFTCATLYDDWNEVECVKDLNNDGLFREVMAPRIKNDAELYELEDSEKLVLDHRSIFKITQYMISRDGQHCLQCFPTLGNLLRAIELALDCVSEAKRRALEFEAAAASSDTEKEVK